MVEGNFDGLRDVGVDYITATYVGPNRDSHLKQFGQYLVQCQKKTGEKLVGFGFSGYRGQHCGSASWGVRHDGVVVRASSGVAKEHWLEIKSLASNITRIDIQVTVQPTVGPSLRLLHHHRQLRRKRRGVGRPCKFKFWYGPDGPEAAIVGRRTSDVFLRAYDKGLESGLPEYAGTLRYEGEFKRKLAVQVADSLESTADQITWIGSKLSVIARHRGLQLPAQGWSRPAPKSLGDSSQLRIVPGSSLAPLDQVLLGQGRARKQSMWLAVAVQPTVQRFLEEGRHEELLTALGLSIENNRLVHKSSETWTTYNKWR